MTCCLDGAAAVHVALMGHGPQVLTRDQREYGLGQTRLHKQMRQHRGFAWGPQHGGHHINPIPEHLSAHCRMRYGEWRTVQPALRERTLCQQAKAAKLKQSSSCTSYSRPVTNSPARKFLSYSSRRACKHANISSDRVCSSAQQLSANSAQQNLEAGNSVIFNGKGGHSSERPMGGTWLIH